MIIKLDNVERAELLKAWSEGVIDTAKFPSLQKYLTSEELLPPVEFAALDRVHDQMFEFDLLQWLEKYKSRFSEQTFSEVSEIVRSSVKT